jgi:RNA polymerase sigma-70 factor (ECF subfamily)
MAERDFDELYASNYGRLVVQVFAVTGNLADAEDAVQEAFARASVRWRRIGGYDSPEAWVRRVALNLAVSGRRRARRLREVLSRVPAPPPFPPLPADSLGLVEALKALPLPFRQVLVLHYLADLPVERVAGELGIAVGTAKSRLSRAREALARQLVDGEEEVGSGRR